MRNQNRKSRSGLILLVVLSMLTLFSLLSITYVVFSSQARSSSMGMARKDFRGTPPATLLDETLRQVLRGTDERSVFWKHDLLGDFYGSGAQVPPPNGTEVHFDDAPMNLNVRTKETNALRIARDNPARAARITWMHPSPLLTAPAAGTFEAPSLFTQSKLVNLPLEWREELPEQHDALNGRILSFLSGPLSGQSFRVVKYVGQIEPIPLPPTPTPAQVLNEQARQALQYSVTIDLSSIDQLSLQSYFTNSVSVYPLFINGSGASAASYRMLLNAAPLNGLGAGMAVADGAIQTIGNSTTNLRRISFAPSIQIPSGGVFDDIAVSILPNYAYIKRANSAFLPTGDIDESYDAPDFANFALSFQHPTLTAPTSKDIIPSLHRPAIINFIYSKVLNDKGSLGNLNEIEFLSLIELLQRACGRPLSFNITNLTTVSPSNISQNPRFSGSNVGDYPAQAPELDIDFSQWTTNAAQQQAFEAWVRWLLNGPWDVDNTGDGLADSVWLPIEAPLMTSPEGKLLKLLAAVYVEDMGGRLDANASGNRAQADSTTFSVNTGTESAFRSGAQILQGGGFGTADISLRHLFSGDLPYWRFVGERANANIATPNASLINFGPGVEGIAINDTVSALRERNRSNHNYKSLPGLPLSVFGKSGVAIDLFGNPRVHDSGVTNEINDDPYEAHLSNGYRDNLISIAEWERLYRSADWDRTTLPSRLERLIKNGVSATPPNLVQDALLAAAATLSPKNSSTIAPSFSSTFLYDRANPNSPAPPAPPTVQTTHRRVTSFAELLEAMAQKRFIPTPAPPGTTYPYISESGLRQLLPLEFSQNLPLDLNRPFGNRRDDNGNGVVDEASEVNFSEYPGYPANLTPVVEQYAVGDGPFDPTPNGYDTLKSVPFIATTYGGNTGRQLLARHLYCLAQLILPDNYVFPNAQQAFAYGTAERARLLAQWAINVVDFRDSDSVMTRFAYDNNPWTAKTGVFWVPDDGVVWGNEQPELLLTETLAFHDTRITKKPVPAATDWQQHRIPEGSLFMEFLCTRSGGSNALLQGVSDNLYDTSGAIPRLNVAAVTPVDANGNRFPVWRVLLLDPHPSRPVDKESVHAKYLSPAARPTMHYQTATGAGLLWSTDLAANPFSQSDVNRIVWFSSLTPTPTNLALPGITEKEVYYSRAAQALVAGGQYLVVGPRPLTYIGQREQTASPPRHRPSPQRIFLDPSTTTGWVQVWNDVNFPGLWPANNRPSQVPAEPVPLPSNYLSNCVTLVAQAPRPNLWTNLPGPGVNISEPTGENYYPEPNEQLNKNDTGTDPLTGASGFAGLPPDAYVDLGTSPATNSPYEPFDNDPARSSSMLGSWGNDGNGNPQEKSQSDWSTAILQRLANPSIPWHDSLNPYITVDWMPIDLTVFNGEMDGAGTAVHFASRQKSGLETSSLSGNVDNLSGKTLYSYFCAPTPVAQPTTATAPNAPFFKFKLPLEYEDEPNVNNNSVTRLDKSGALALHDKEFATLGYLNSRFGLRGLNGGSIPPTEFLGASVHYDGPLTPTSPALAPVSPFWANRDYLNSYELMNVPVSGAGPLLQEFSIKPNANSLAFTHVLDFEMQAVPNSTLPKKPASLLLDLVSARDAWGDSEKVLDPTSALEQNPTTGEHFLLNNALSIFQPPFNRVPTYVQRGRVNLNTASNTNVFRGLMWSAMTTDRYNASAAVPFEADWRSTLVTGTASSSLTALAPPYQTNAHLHLAYPTEFISPMRSGFNVDNALVNTAANNTASVSLLRGSATTSRLFTTQNLYSPTDALPHNPAIYNSAASRMVNLTTDHSNVFAVRVTIGYFEYDPATGLGAEYGLDEGKARRHRAFYVIDRSVPVAYQEGQDMNTENCILMRRIIE